MAIPKDRIVRDYPSKKSLLRWCRALASVWILGTALGFSGNLLFGPSMTKTASGTATPTIAATPPPTLIAVKTPPVQGETSPSA